ncbi:MAG: hypothetical protein QM802_16425 [Agriterribacter sp.]
MKAHIKLNRSLLLFLLLLSLYSNAQFAFKAAISEVKQPGFHRIMVPPALTAKSNADLSDIRIIDEFEKPVPYLLKREQPLINDKELKIFPIVSVTKSKDSNTQIILQALLNEISNPMQAGYSFVLVIKNANVYRDASILGSDDMHEWFAIDDKILLGNSENETGDEYLQVISLPPIRYKYLAITIKDKGTSPLNIVKAGLLLTRNIYGKYVELPSPVIKQIDSSNHKTYGVLHFNEAYPVSKLHFTLTGSSLYKRKITVYDTSGLTAKQLGETMLEPGKDSLIVYGDKCKNILAVIDNNDDLPLRISEVHAFQLNQYLIADFKPGKKYFILCGYESAGAPVYDLQYFTESIKVVDEKLTVDTPQKNEGVSKMPVIKKVLITSFWLWLIIVVVLLLLAFLTYRLVKEIPKK